MTNNIKSKFKVKLVSILIAIATICFSMFFLTACSESSSSEYEDPNYTLNQETSDLNNGSFNVGVNSATSFPKVTTNSWSLTNDTNALTSNISSGVVGTKDDAWKSLVENLYNDDDFLSFVKYKFNIDKQSSKEDTVNLILTKFSSPKLHSDSLKDSYVYMINNYRKVQNTLGTAQKLTTSTSFTLEKGGYAKFSVWVKTAFLSENGVGANIRLVNTINSVTQDTYIIQDINTSNVTDNNGWQNFVIYAKADDFVDCTVKLALGLGLQNGSNNALYYSEGIAFFDDITYKKLTAEEFEAEIAGKTSVKNTYLEYSSKTTNKYQKVSAKNAVGDYYLCSLSVQDSIDNYTTNYQKNIELNDITHNYTSSANDGLGNPITSQTIFGQDKSYVNCTTTTNEIKLTNIKNAAYTVTLADSRFVVPYQSYFYFSFKIQNKLSILDASDGIKVYVHDIFDGENDIITANSTTFDIKDDYTICSILLKNNFPDGGEYINNKKFSIVITIGPDVVNQNSTFANGESITINDFKYAIGSTESEADYKNFYDLFSSITTPIALVNGEDSDYSDTSSSEYYNLSPSYSEAGTITSYPSAITGYTGVTSNHIYVSTQTENTTAVIDDRSGSISGKSHAGLINTKYLDNYATLDGLGDIKSALGWTGGDNIQTLMIYNNEADSYGYIGQTTTISPTTDSSLISFAVINFRIKVVGDAKAYVYVVDLSSNTKSVLTIDVKSNANDLGEYVTEQTKFVKNIAFEGIGETDGWVDYQINVGVGTESKNIRLEIWNGSRDGLEKSSGYVFVDYINVNTTSGNVAPSDFNDIGSSSSNPIANNYSELTEKVLYRQVLTDQEVKFNNEYPKDAVSYKANYIWAKSETMIYATYHLTDPVVVDPYKTLENDTDAEGSTTDTENLSSANFWLSISSIILAVVLISAILVLIIKNARRKKKANMSDAKSHYTVRSRNANKEEPKVKKESTKKQIDTYEDEEFTYENEEDKDYDISDNDEQVEQNIEEYVYGDVLDFGETEGEKLEDTNSSEDKNI